MCVCVCLARPASHSYLDTNDWDLEAAKREAEADAAWERQEAERLRQWQEEQQQHALAQEQQQQVEEQTTDPYATDDNDDDDDCCCFAGFWSNGGGSSNKRRNRDLVGDVQLTSGGASR